MENRIMKKKRFTEEEIIGILREVESGTEKRGLAFSVSAVVHDPSPFTSYFPWLGRYS